MREHCEDQILLACKGMLVNEIAEVRKPLIVVGVFFLNQDRQQFKQEGMMFPSCYEPSGKKVEGVDQYSS